MMTTEKKIMAGTTVPTGVGAPERPRRKVPELVTMWKYMLSKSCAYKRRDINRYLNDALYSGELSRIVGYSVLNRAINGAAFKLTGADFWKVDRESFYADVKVTLRLQSPNGFREWSGTIVCWCSFDKGFNMTIESLCKRPYHMESELVLMDWFTIPYYTNAQREEFAESLWKKYNMPEALTDPSKRVAKELARRMGLRIMYLDVYDHGGDVDAILFYEDGMLLCGEDRIDTLPDGQKVHIKTGVPTKIKIPANTIVINTNLHSEFDADFYIFHECVHYELHYMFYRLQKMASNDPRQIKMVETTEDRKNPLISLESQADRCAYALMMPREDTIRRIDEARRRVSGYKNDGGMYQMVARSVGWHIGVSAFLVRHRMVQLGYFGARGAMNSVEGKLIQPFSFSDNCSRSGKFTYVVNRDDVAELYHKDMCFKTFMNSGSYVYADGHVVKNDPRYVRWEGYRYLLTDEAARQVDVCCVRFVRKYVLKDRGYISGRMFHDPHYLERVLFYLSETMRDNNMDELDAEPEYKRTFPGTFEKAFDKLMLKNDETRESAAYRLHMSTDTLKRWLKNGPPKDEAADFVIRLALMWEVPDFITEMMLERAGVVLKGFDRRSRALEHVFTDYWDKGIEGANTYLAEKQVALLAAYETEKVEGRKRVRSVS